MMMRVAKRLEVVVIFKKRIGTIHHYFTALMVLDSPSIISALASRLCLFLCNITPVCSRITYYPAIFFSFETAASVPISNRSFSFLGIIYGWYKMLIRTRHLNINTVRVLRVFTIVEEWNRKAPSFARYFEAHCT